MGMRRIILYLLLGVLLAALWNAWKLEHPAATPAAPKASVTPTGAVSPVGVGNGGAAANAPTKTHADTTTAVHTPNMDTQVVTTAQSDVLSLGFDAAGNVVQAKLLQYDHSVHDRTPVRLLGHSATQWYVMKNGFVAASGSAAVPGNLNFHSDKKQYTLADGQSGLDITFQATLPSGVKLEKIYRLSRGQYAVAMHYRVHNTGSKPWVGSFYGQIQRLPPAKHKRFAMLGFHSFTGASLSTIQDPYEKFTFSKLSASPISRTVRGGWLAMQQHYFLSAWVPMANERNHYYSSTQMWQDNPVYTLGYAAPLQTVSPGQQVVGRSQFYIGPELAKQLDALAPHLSMTIDYGFFWWIAVPIVKLLTFLHKIIGNWGWSIVAVTLLFQLVFYKFNEKSFRSMAKMRDLAPRQKALKERFKDDKEGLQKATIALYRDEKINPLGGCLPILIQIPVFISLYYALGESVALRQAPFILWIQDLSVRDPYFVLPVLMGISMFFQQRMSPTTMDAAQARMMMFMPVLFTGLFLLFPSGLVLYWLTRNLATIAQQWNINRNMKLEKKRKKQKR